MNNSVTQWLRAFHCCTSKFLITQMETVSKIYSQIFLKCKWDHIPTCLKLSTMQCWVEKKKNKFNDQLLLTSSCICSTLILKNLLVSPSWMVGPLFGILTPFPIFFSVEFFRGCWFHQAYENFLFCYLAYISLFLHFCCLNKAFTTFYCFVNLKEKERHCSLYLLICF